MNLHLFRRPIYLLRHGESEYNLENRVGGDPDLTPKGYVFAEMLEDFFKKELPPNSVEMGV